LSFLSIVSSRLKTQILLLAALAACGPAMAQNLKRINGLVAIMDRGCSDSMMVRLNLEVADEFIFNNPDTARYYSLRALELATRIGDTSRMAKASNYLGITHFSQGQFVSALEFYQNAQTLSRQVNDRAGALKAMNNIGIVYTNLGDYRKAIETQAAAYEENMAIGNATHAAYNLYNIASGYLSLRDIPKARAMVNRIDELQKLDASVAMDLSSIMGEIYLEENKPDSAVMALSKALEVSRSEGDEYFMTSLHLSQARAYLQQRNFEEASIQLEEAGLLIWKNGFDNQRLTHLQLEAEWLSEKGLHIEAFRKQKRYTILKDSLDRVNNLNRISELSARYESERQASRIARQDQELLEKSSQFRLAIMGGGAFCLLAALVFVNLLRKRRMNALLRIQNKEIKSQRQKIISSLDYARRIQTAILPNDQQLAGSFHEWFIFFRPRDIVSGDIYWCREMNGVIYLAVIDCTGHGVPGAFMSLIAYSKLNKVIGTGDRSCHEIMWDLHKEVVSTLNQGTADAAPDGMDMSLCRIDRASATLEYCGANHAIHVYSGSELTEYRSNPHSLGGTWFERRYGEGNNPFTSIRIHYEQGDALFMHSDGMMDQIGGPSRRKLNKSRFRDLLTAIAEAPMKRGEETCSEALLGWRRSAPQTDDILVLGVRL